MVTFTMHQAQPSAHSPVSFTSHLQNATGALCPFSGWQHSSSSLQVVMTINELFLDRDQKKKQGRHLLNPGHVNPGISVALMSLSFCPPPASGWELCWYTVASVVKIVIIIIAVTIVNRSLRSRAPPAQPSKSGPNYCGDRGHVSLG